MHQAILFDLGKVLVQFDFQRGYRRLEQVSRHKAAEIPRLIAPTGLVERFETGLIEPEDFVAQLCTALKLGVDYQEFCTIWSSIFTDPLIPEEMVGRLASRYRMLLVSNTNRLHFDMLRANYPVLRHFHELVLSYEVKAMKPDPRMFQAAVERARCRAEECFYVDDLAANVEAARKLAIDAVQFESAEQIARELKDRGIDW